MEAWQAQQARRSREEHLAEVESGCRPGFAEVGMGSPPTTYPCARLLPRSILWTSILKLTEGAATVCPWKRGAP